jgi:methionyl-tRNA formyltransferase
VRAAFAGTPEFALPALEALSAHHELVGVLTQPDRRSGRGRHLSMSPVKEAALAHHFPLAQPQTLRDAATIELLRSWNPEVLVVVAYGLLLPAPVLNLPPLGCLNIHASLLPRWRGAAPIQRAILAGDPDSGVSIMRMDAGLDTGPVLIRRPLAISAGYTSGTLHAALAPLGAAALLEALEGVAQGTLSATPQEEAGVSYAAKVTKAEARIDWRCPAIDIERQVRAFNPWPVAETTLAGEPLRILAAHVLPMGANQASSEAKIKDPGAIVAVRDDSVVVRCGHGYLGLTQLQRPGRRVLSARDYSHGLELAGRRLG